jgi:hypothetical protein
MFVRVVTAIGLMSFGANFLTCTILRAQNVIFYLVTVTLLIAAKQCPDRAPATNETDTPPVKRRGSSFLKPKIIE